MKLNKKIFFIILLAVFALTLGACSGNSRRVGTTGWSGITSLDEVVYFSSGPHVYALSHKNGSQVWQFPIEPIKNLVFYAAPMVADDGTQLIIGGYNSTIYSLDPNNGQKKWEYVVPKKDNEKTRFIASPLITDQAIFASASNNNLYALDFDGLPLWVFKTEDPIWASPALSETCNCIYLASMDHYLYALSPDTGELLWKTDDLGGPIVSQPAVSESGLVIVSTFGNEVIALEEDSHQVVWRFKTNDWAWASPVIDGEQVYASDISGTIFALDLASGELVWKLQPGGRIFSAPLVVGDQVYFSTDASSQVEKASSLVVVSSEGVVQRNLPIEGKLYASPAADGDNILLAPSEAEFFMIALNQNSIQVWGFSPSK